MSERVIDFSEIEIGDVLDIRMKEDDIIIGNAKVSEFDAYDNSYYIPAIEYWLFESVVESIILKSRTRVFEPGVYINKLWRDRPQNAIIWCFSGDGWSEVSGELGHPEGTLGTGWREELVRLVPEA